MSERVAEVLYREMHSPYKAALPAPKLYLCGFPKSGLHLAEQMVQGVCQRWPQDKGWFGTNAWTNERHALKNVGVALGSLEHGEYMKGHMGFLKSIEALMVGLNVGCVFVYRDLRDVVVSQMHHVLEENEDWNHPDKELYRDLGDEEAVMCAVIEGYGKYPGIFERWEQFHGWMKSPWVFSVRFRDMLRRRRMVAMGFFQYAFKVAQRDAERKVTLYDTSLRDLIVDAIVVNMKGKDTPTYRKGKVGSWKDEFTPQVVETFKEHDPGWLVRLGFEKDDKWQLPTATQP